MRAEIERIMHTQAQQFINEQLVQREEEIKRNYEERFNQRMAQGQPNPMQNFAFVDMSEDEEEKSSQPGTVTPNSELFPFARMGTRRKPTDIGRVPNMIRNRVSNDSSLEPSQFRI